MRHEDGTGGDRLTAVYLIETAFPLADAAAVVAGEQSTGTFVRLPGETDALRDAHAARVEAIEEIGEAERPALPGAKTPGDKTPRHKAPKAGAAAAANGTSGAGPRWRRARITLSWPLANFGVSLPNVLSTVAGNLYELGAVSALKLLDLDFPAAFADRCPGPQFGVAGTRRLAGVERGILVGTIVKPSVGLSPEATAAVVDDLAAGGIDFVKDDELQADGPHCPLAERVAAVMRVVERHADRTGRKPMIAFNITGEVDEMLRHHDTVVAHGGTCVMVSLNAVGLAGLGALRRHSALPIHAHRNGWGALSRSPDLGFAFPAWSKLWRLAGVDHMHVNGIRNKFSEDDATAIAAARSCRAPMFPPPARDFAVMPVFSSGQWAGQAAETYAALGSDDAIYACGGGIIAHPDGIAAGVASVREAWAAAAAGIPAAAYAKSHPALAAALAAFG